MTWFVSISPKHHLFSTILHVQLSNALLLFMYDMSKKFIENFVFVINEPFDVFVCVCWYQRWRRRHKDELENNFSHKNLIICEYELTTLYLLQKLVLSLKKTHHNMSVEGIEAWDEVKKRKFLSKSWLMNRERSRERRWCEISKYHSYDSTPWHSRAFFTI